MDFLTLYLPFNLTFVSFVLFLTQRTTTKRDCWQDYFHGDSTVSAVEGGLTRWGSEGVVLGVLRVPPQGWWRHDDNDTRMTPETPGAHYWWMTSTDFHRSEESRVMRCFAALQNLTARMFILMTCILVVAPCIVTFSRESATLTCLHQRAVHVSNVGGFARGHKDSAYYRPCKQFGT